jgi:curved DNA-binding protein CbpA
MAFDPWEVLGVPRTATAAEIKRAWRDRAREWHPDRNPSPDAERRFKEIARSYEVLSDPRRRELLQRQQAAGAAVGGPSRDFLADFTDAVERAEALVFRLVLPHALERGLRAETVVRLALDFAQDRLPSPESLPGLRGRWRSRSWKKRLDVVIDYDRPGPPSEIQSGVAGSARRWRIWLRPTAFWSAGLREAPALDEAVARHVQGSTIAVLAHQAGVRYVFDGIGAPAEMLERAREIDRRLARRRAIQAAIWLVVAALAAAMLYAGYMSRYA